MRKFTIRKFDGDDFYSWAVFKTVEVRGKGPVIFWGDACPLASGLSKQDAISERNYLEREKEHGSARN